MTCTCQGLMLKVLEENAQKSFTRAVLLAAMRSQQDTMFGPVEVTDTLAGLVHAGRVTLANDKYQLGGTSGGGTSGGAGETINVEQEDGGAAEGVAAVEAADGAAAEGRHCGGRWHCGGMRKCFG